MTAAFFDIGLVLAAASVLALILNRFKQPLLVGYILAGIISGALGLLHEENLKGILEFLSVFGITFVLFLVGLELRFREIKTYGLIALITGVGQIIFTSIVGFLLLTVLRFSFTEAFYVAIAITFSSTIIVVKLLTEKRDLDSLYGKITVGFLLVQDAVAILALILVTALSGGNEASYANFLSVVIKGIILVLATVFLARNIVPWVFAKASKSLEVLFVLSVGWVLLVASLASYLGLSIEIGAFLAGVSLANLPVEHQIASRVRPLRDLFIVFFFVLLGISFSFGNVLNLLLPITVLSVFILVGNPLIVLAIMGFLGFRKRTSFLASITVAQISEFSLILVALGHKVGDLSQEIVDMVTAVGLLTILGSSYLITHGSSLYKKLSKYLDIFEKAEKIEEIRDEEKDFEDHVVLIGAGRLGWEIWKQLQRQGKQILVIEFNPSIVAVLKQERVNYLFGDVTDPDIFEAAHFNKASLVISTVFDPSDTSELLASLKVLPSKPLVFVTSADREGAIRFYREGADYVIIPRILSGHQVAHLLTSEKLTEFRSGKVRKDHLEDLREEVAQFT